MQNRAHRFGKCDTVLSLRDLERYGQGWLLDSEIRQHSPATRAARELLIQKLLWFFREKEITEVGTLELRQFLAYLSTGHEQPGGRWGNDRLKQKAKPSTVVTYFGNLRTFFRWLLEEGALDESPMEALRPPVNRTDQIQPFTAEQVEALQRAARRSRDPRRDEAIVLFLLDTGVRVSEACSLRVRDLDFTQRTFRVTGKGHKERSLYFGAAVGRALMAHLRERTDDVDGLNAPLFVGGGGNKPGSAMTRSGMLQLIERLGKAAGIDTVRCSPHTFRHTFAVEFLRDGGNIFTLKELLGHTTLAMVNRYVALAEADLESQHRKHSPADRLHRRRRP